MSALPVGGKLLTPEQTMRLAMLDSMGRERVIEAYVTQIRAVEARRTAKGKAWQGRSRRKAVIRTS